MRYVYCHPLFEERKCAHRFSYELVQAFAAHGSKLERFDYAGTGEDEGEFAKITLESLREDMDRVLKDDELCLLGLRLGASLGWDYCLRRPGRVRKLIMIEPIIDGGAYVEHLFRKQHLKDIMTGGTAAGGGDANGYRNIEGYKTSEVLLEQLRGFDLLNKQSEFSLPIEIVIIILAASCRDAQVRMLAYGMEGRGRRVSIRNVSLPIFWERNYVPDYRILTEMVVSVCYE